MSGGGREVAATAPAAGATSVLVLEPIGGIAGDMCLAALLDLARSLGRHQELRRRLDRGLAALAAAAAGDGSLDLAAVRVVEEPASVCGIASLHVEVAVPAEVQARQPPHRPFRLIRDLLGRAALPEGARSKALAAFARLAEAEGEVHGVPSDEVEFHEVGGLDSIVDMTGTALLIDALAPTRVLCLPPPTGGGTSLCAHGPLPVPTPATLKVLRGRALRPSGPGERTTPTGAALCAVLADEAMALPPMTFLGAGYGAGTKRWDDAPNLLRAVWGTQPTGAPGPLQALWQLEVNLDDLPPQLVSAAQQALLEAGARDAWVTPVVMKKGRPGHLLGVLCDEALRPALEQLLFRETSTLGVRAFRVERSELERRFAEVQTPYGPVRVKLGLQAGAVANAWPEFDDCARAARERGVAVKEVIAAALAAWRPR